MENIIKTIMFCLVMTIALGIISSPAIAQVGFGAPPLWQYPAFFQQPLAVPAQSPYTGDLLIDNFEYWDSPYNHNWIQIEPAYPVYGFGIGYATRFNTILDLQEGSRVLDVFRPPSVFLLSTPYAKHGIRYPCAGCIDLDPEDFPVLSFKLRAPLGIEPWDIFEFVVVFENGCTIRIVPLQGPCQNCNGPYIVSDDGNCNFTVQIGREFMDGSWHVVWIDLLDIIAGSDCDCGNICAIMASGQMFRLDDIYLRAGYGHELMDYPDLFEMGPLYAQIFEPYRYLFIADYAGASISAQHPHDPNADNIETDAITHIMLHPDLIETDPNKIWQFWLSDLNITDPNYLDADFDDPNDPYIKNATLKARSSLNAGADFFIIPSLPVFKDPNMRLGGSMINSVIAQGTLGWNSTIGGTGSSGVEAFLLQVLPINPFDGMPTYIPAYYTAIDAIEKYGVAHFSPDLVFLLESALWNAGMKVWPNIAYMDYTPYVFEDMIVTIEVTNGVHSDVRTFPISVVNYPIENYPPVLQLDIDDQLFYIGDPDPHANEYVMVFIDPDCYIFSLAGPSTTGTVPATTHTPAIWGSFRTDQGNLTYRATLDGLPSYQFGPWMSTIINPKSGLIKFTPQFEGAYDIVVTCTDDRGASAVGEVTIFCVNSGTWLNHPPIILGGPTQPVTLKAGEEFTLHEPNFAVEDPDGDEIYASCNIGSVGKTSERSIIWTFQSNFPGTYMVEIIFYDIRGGYAIMEFFLDVKPWWSY